MAELIAGNNSERDWPVVVNSIGADVFRSRRDLRRDLATERDNRFLDVEPALRTLVSSEHC